MGFIVLGIISLILLLVLKILFGYSQKTFKELAENKELDELAKKYPDNIDICKDYLKKLNNEKVEIEQSEDGEAEDGEASLYIAISNKIIIANIKKTFTRIQTIAHECLHSIQDRKLLLFNFIFSNIYLLYFIVVALLAIFKVLPYEMLFVAIFLVLSCVYITVRTYLENDAMIKARFLAKEYMEEKKISSKEEIEKLVNGFDEVNKVGIKCVNYYFFMEVMMKLFVLCTICLIR